jgi:hypothetical protein
VKLDTALGGRVNGLEPMVDTAPDQEVAPGRRIQEARGEREGCQPEASGREW